MPGTADSGDDNGGTKPRLAARVPFTNEVLDVVYISRANMGGREDYNALVTLRTLDAGLA